MSDYTEALFVSTVVYRETMEAAEPYDDSLHIAGDPWAVRLEEGFVPPSRAIDYTVDCEPIPLEREEEQRLELKAPKLGFLSLKGVEVNFVEVEIDLPRNAQFLPYPDIEDAYGLELVVRFGA